MTAAAKPIDTVRFAQHLRDRVSGDEVDHEKDERHDQPDDR